MTTRITGETRQALEKEAERTGRSIGQVAEMWLEQARALAADGQPVPGSAEAVTAMLRFSASVRTIMSKKVKYSEEEMRLAVIAGWGLLSEASFPFAKRSRASVDLDDKAEVFAAACNALLTAWERSVEDSDAPPDPVVKALTSLPQEQDDTGNTVAKVSVHRMLIEAYSSPRRLTNDTLDDLESGLRAARDLGSSLRKEIDVILTLLPDFRAALGVARLTFASARNSGRIFAKSFLGIPFDEWRLEELPVDDRL